MAEIRKDDKVKILKNGQTGIVTNVVNFHGITQVWIRGIDGIIYVYDDKRHYEKLED